MMHFTGFKSKAALKEAVKVRKVRFVYHRIETSMFGDEFKEGRAAEYCVCLDHPKRTKFAAIKVDADGFITSVR